MHVRDTVILPVKFPSAFRIDAAHWQDAWAVKLSNPPPKTLGISGGVLSPRTGAVDALSSDASGVSAAKQAASDAARGAVTIGFAGSVIGVVVILSVALCLVLRRASHGGGGALARALFVCLFYSEVNGELKVIQF